MPLFRGDGTTFLNQLPDDLITQPTRLLRLKFSEGLFAMHAVSVLLGGFDA